MKENRLIGGKELSANTLAEIEREREVEKVKIQRKKYWKIDKGRQQSKEM